MLSWKVQFPLSSLVSFPKSGAPPTCIVHWWVLVGVLEKKETASFAPLTLKDWMYLRDLLSSKAKAELMNVPDYNNPLRHTNLPRSPSLQPPASRVRGDSRHMIDVCLWRNQEGAQINFSLSSFDFIWLIYFLTSSQDAAWRMVNEENELFGVANL